MSTYCQLQKRQASMNKEYQGEPESEMPITEGGAFEQVDELEPMTEIRGEAPKTKKHRGPTKLASVHARTVEERPIIVLNKYGQPVGPTKVIVDEFTRFLGTIARDPELAPLNYCLWPKIPTLDRIWKYVLYRVPEEGKKWVLENIGRKWRGHKCRTKKLYYYAYETDEERWKHRPDTISEPQFEILLKYWNFPPIEQQEHPEKEEPPLVKVYTESRRRDPKKEYKTSFVKTKDNIQMEALITQVNGEGPDQGEPYYQVIKKPEHSGRLRLFGQGVTKSDLKKKGKRSGYIFPQEFVQSIQTDLLEKLQEANPDVSFVIPESMKGNSSNGTKAKSTSGNLEGGQSSFSTSQVQVDQPNGPNKGACVVNDDQTME